MIEMPNHKNALSLVAACKSIFSSKKNGLYFFIHCAHLPAF